MSFLLLVSAPQLFGVFFCCLFRTCRQRGNEHVHVAAFHLRRILDNGYVLEVVCQTFENGKAL